LSSTERLSLRAIGVALSLKKNINRIFKIAVFKINQSLYLLVHELTEDNLKLLNEYSTIHPQPSHVNNTSSPTAQELQ
jgi:hypothetical protein